MKFDARLRRLEKHPSFAKSALILIVEPGEDLEEKLAKVLNGRKLEDFAPVMIQNFSGSRRRSDGPSGDSG